MEISYNLLTFATEVQALTNLHPEVFGFRGGAPATFNLRPYYFCSKV
nr:MAG TPA: hypothetical protein [Bacteriophage sp.]